MGVTLLRLYDWNHATSQEILDKCVDLGLRFWRPSRDTFSTRARFSGPAKPIPKLIQSFQRRGNKQWFDLSSGDCCIIMGNEPIFAAVILWNNAASSRNRLDGRSATCSGTHSPFCLHPVFGELAALFHSITAQISGSFPMMMPAIPDDKSNHCLFPVAERLD